MRHYVKRIAFVSCTAASLSGCAAILPIVEEEGYELIEEDRLLDFGHIESKDDKTIYRLIMAGSVFILALGAYMMGIKKVMIESDK